MSKSSKRPMKSWFNAKNAAAYRRQRNREYTTRHEEVMAAKREGGCKIYVEGKLFREGKT